MLLFRIGFRPATSVGKGTPFTKRSGFAIADAQLNRILGQVRAWAARGEEAGQTDGELLREFLQSWYAPAFEELVRRHGPMVAEVCERNLGNRADAEDAFQTTFLVLLQRRSATRPHWPVGCTGSSDVWRP